MTTMTVTEFARNIKRALDRLEFSNEEIVIVRNKQEVARLIPGSVHMTALEVMADIYRTLPDEAGEEWIKDGRIEKKLSEEIRDPWDF